MSWGEKIRAIRESYHLSQKEFAERGQLSESMIRSVEAGTRQISVPALDNLLRGVGLSLPEFFSSNVIERYAKSSHQRLHEQLQELLESDTDAVKGITVSIEWMHSELLSRRSKKKKSKTDKEVGTHGRSLTPMKQAGQTLEVLDGTGKGK